MLSSKDAAKITSAHYGYDQFSKDPKLFESKMTENLPEGFYVNYGLSNRGIMVAEKGNQRVISVKGTDPSSPKDLLSDFQLALGLHKSNIQFRQRKNEIKNIMRRNPEKEYHLVGHSLGSSILANALASSPSILRNTTKAYLFNQGSTPAFEAMLKPRPENVSMVEKKTIHYKHADDILSHTAGKYGDVIISRKKKKGMNPHSILNWI